LNPKLRPHRNGGGLVQDFVEIARKVRVEPPARVQDNAEVSGSGLVLGDSYIRGRAIVTDAPRVEDTIIEEFAVVTGHPFLYKALVQSHAIISGSPSITHSEIGGTARIQDGAIVNDSVIDGNALIGQSALVQASHISGNVVVLGGELHNVGLDQNQRVHEGIWHRAPRYLEHPDVPLAMTECINNHVIIGCLCRSVGWWKLNAGKMQQEYGWSNEATQWIWDNIDSMHSKDDAVKLAQGSFVTANAKPKIIKPHRPDAPKKRRGGCFMGTCGITKFREARRLEEDGEKEAAA
jgi:acetyltransferase-like isoleucine patch superfamily enzyme